MWRPPGEQGGWEVRAGAKRTGEGPKPHPHDSTLGESSRAPAACSFPGENARSWEALGEARPGQSSLSAGRKAVRDRLALQGGTGDFP